MYPPGLNVVLVKVAGVVVGSGRPSGLPIPVVDHVVSVERPPRDMPK
jgi:hypothetical protein